MRSSSEWKVTTASRPPGFSMRSARASARDKLAEFVVDDDAQRLERPRRRMDVARLAPHDALDDVRPARWSCAIGASRRARDDGAGDARANAAPRRA